MEESGKAKRKGTAVSQTVSQLVQQARPSQWSGWCETRQAQGRELVVRAEPGMGDGLPSRTRLDRVVSLGPGVAAGESHSKRPSLSGPADGTISAIDFVD